MQPLHLAIAIVALLAIAPMAAAQAPPFEHSYALVIAIEKYPLPRWPALPSVATDAGSVTSLLRAQGFQVTALSNEQANKFGIISALQRLARLVQKRDRVVVYFAGHGYTETFAGRDYGYIVPYDGGDDSASFVSMEELQTQSEKMGAAIHQLFIMDSCFGGLLSLRDPVGINPNVPNYIDELSKRPARQVVTAGGKNQRVVSNGPNGHSVFVNAFLEALEKRLADANSDGFVTFSELMAYVQRRASNAYQTPAAGSLPHHGLGEFVFRVGPDRPGANQPAESVRPIFRDTKPADTRTAIREVLSAYRAAYENRDVDALLAVFPSFQGGGELRRRFADVQSAAMAIGLANITETSSSTATAVTPYSMTYTSRTGAIEQTRPMRAEFKLRRDGSEWIIESVRFN